MPVVEAELALLGVEQEDIWVHPAEPCQLGLGVAPEKPFDAVDLIAAPSGGRRPFAVRV